MDEKLKRDKGDMIARANDAINDVAIEFIESLHERIAELDRAIYSNNRTQVIDLSYNLESEAAIFGFPRITRICKWLRKVFTGEFDQKPEAEDVLKVINALKLMVADPRNPNEERDAALFRELYPVLARVVSDV